MADSVAQIHAAIASKVYPDACSIEVDLSQCWVKLSSNPYIADWFNLLETDSNGNPTMQAKASALDVLVWMVDYLNEVIDDSSKGEDRRIACHKRCEVDVVLESDNPCAAIYEAAKEIVTATQQ